MLPNSLKGLGAMAEWRDVVQIVVDRFSLRKAAVGSGDS